MPSPLLRSIRPLTAAVTLGVLSVASVASADPTGYEEPVASPAPAPAEAAPQPPPPVVVVAPAPAAPPAPAPLPPPPSRRRGVGMMVAGYSMFGMSYMITAFSGAAIIDRCDADARYDCRRLGRALMIPVLGPFLALPEIQTMTGRFAMVFFPGVMQAGGLALGIGGSVRHARSRRYYGMVNADGVRLVRGRELRIAPAGSGAQLTLRF